jgi:monoamine oxidase
MKTHKHKHKHTKSFSRNPLKKTMKSSSVYDLVIIGAGIAGLYTALESLKSHPDWKIIVLEQYNIGGRIWSPEISAGKSKPIHIEAGAGRIPTSHTRIMKIIQDYHLPTFPITTEKSYRISPHLLQDSTTTTTTTTKDFLTNPNQSNSKMSPESIIQDFKKRILPTLDSQTLRNHTLYELIEKHYGISTAEDFRYFFEYDSEIFVANAEAGLSLIDCTLLQKDFIGVAGGLETIPTKMTQSIRSLGGIILEKVKVLKISPNSKTSQWKVIIQKESKSKSSKKIIQSKQVVIGTSLKPMKELLQSLQSQSQSILKINDILEHIHPGSLLRVYAKFPKCWFKGIGKVVTSNAIRYFIPINEEECVAMVSYTDGFVAKAWNELHKNMGRRIFIQTILDNLKIVFPEKESIIEEPIWVREYYWPSGCHYWGKGIPHGGYTNESQKKELFNPLPGLYLCGEVISKTQAWIEGGLETAEIVLSMMNHT